MSLRNQLEHQRQKRARRNNAAGLLTKVKGWNHDCVFQPFSFMATPVGAIQLHRATAKDLVSKGMNFAGGIFPEVALASPVAYFQNTLKPCRCENFFKI